MLEYEGLKPLLQFLGTPKLPLKHWSDNSSWCMAGHMVASFGVVCLTTCLMCSMLSANWNMFVILLQTTKPEEEGDHPQRQVFYR
jgi:hypothetical protein